MALNIDSTRPLVSTAQKRALVEAVRDAQATESEPDWLEWKSTVNLSEKHWQFEIARFVLGAGNRMPERAARAADGHAYMMLGVEPQNLCGVVRVDNAQLEQGVSAYTGHDGPHWSPDYIEVGGVEVLVVTIAPPKLGDRIFTLAKEWEVHRNGAVFVRRSGKTEQATSAEMRQLSERLLGAQTRPQLDIEVDLLDSDSILTPVDLSEASVNDVLQSERRALARPRPVQPDLSDPFGVAGAVRGIANMQNLLQSASLAFGTHAVPEDRDPEEYDLAIERYLKSVEARIVALAAERAVSSRLSILRLALRNRTVDNYDEVAVNVHLPGDVWAYNSVYEAEDAVHGVEARPRKWGPRTVSPFNLRVPIIPTVNPIRFSTPSIRNDGSARIAYPPVHLRPEANYPLDAVFVVVAAGVSRIVGEWQATSKSVSGVARGRVEITLGAPISLVELFNRPDHEDDEAE